MNGYPSGLSAEELRSLRQLVRKLRIQGRRGVPTPDLLALARDIGKRTGLTIDFDAVEELGDALIVLRQPLAGPPPALEGLTTREREVAGLVALGRTNKEIAEHLSISLATVKDHVHRILEKSGLPGRAGIIAAYLAKG